MATIATLEAEWAAACKATCAAERAVGWEEGYDPTMPGATSPAMHARDLRAARDAYHRASNAEADAYRRLSEAEDAAALTEFRRTA